MLYYVSTIGGKHIKYLPHFYICILAYCVVRFDPVGSSMCITQIYKSIYRNKLAKALILTTVMRKKTAPLYTIITPPALTKTSSKRITFPRMNCR